MTRVSKVTRVAAVIVEPDAHGQAALLLTESLIHMLVETRKLTIAQAIDVVRTAALVKVEVAQAAGESRARMLESLHLLSRMENSLQADFDAAV